MKVTPGNILNVKELRVLDAYFAKKEIQKVVSVETHAYTFKSQNNTKTKKNKEDIAAIILRNLNKELKGSKGTTKNLIVEALTKDVYKKGDTINIKLNKDKLVFKRKNKGELNEDLYVVVKTHNLQGKTVKLNVLQGKAEVLEKEAAALKLQQGERETLSPEVKVGNYSNDDTIENKDDFIDWAIFKIKIGPKKEKDLKVYNDAIDKLKEKKTYVFLLIDAHSAEDLKIIYNGCDENLDGKPDQRNTTNHWLDYDEKWFELKKGCDCGKSLNLKFKCVKFNSLYGPVNWGSKKIAQFTGWDTLLKEKKITKEEKEILIGMSENEGKLDAVQSYDKDLKGNLMILTAGAMQKTVDGTGEGEFVTQVEQFKKDNPKKYKLLFEDCGWTVESKKMYYKDPKIDDAKKITGEELAKKVREGFTKDKYKKHLRCAILEPIVKAITDKDFQNKQVADFITRLNKVVLEIKPKGHTTYKLKDFLKSKLGKATALDHHINRPAHVDDDFGKSLDNFFSKKDKEIDEANKLIEKENANINDPNLKKKKKEKISKDPSKWGDNHSKYEKEILEDYGKSRRGTDMEERFEKLKNKF